MEVVQVIEKLAEIFELLESNPLLLLESPNQSLQDVFIVLTIEERVPQQNPEIRYILVSDFLGLLSELYLAKSSSDIVAAPLENSPNSMWRTSVWRLSIKLQNWENFNSPGFVMIIKF